MESPRVAVEEEAASAGQVTRYPSYDTSTITLTEVAPTVLYPTALSQGYKLPYSSLPPFYVLARHRANKCAAQRSKNQLKPRISVSCPPTPHHSHFPPLWQIATAEKRGRRVGVRLGRHSRVSPPDASVSSGTQQAPLVESNVLCRVPGSHPLIPSRPAVGFHVSDSERPLRGKRLWVGTEPAVSRDI